MNGASDLMVAAFGDKGRHARTTVGVAVLPQSGLEGHDELVRLRLTHPTLDRRILLVWRPAASPPAGRAFLALAHEHLAPSAEQHLTTRA